MHLSYHRLYLKISLSDFVTRHASLSGSGRILTSTYDSVGLVSNSRCIYDNLAAEEALLRGVILQPQQQCLFMYINNPCVVIGRNQNVFQEVALRTARRDGVPIARRPSGGGAVYHDTGNLCLSFFTHREGYQPNKTIQILRHFVSTYCGIHKERLTTTSRHDLFLDGKKITGSAMRVQRDIAYHHCTLLVASRCEDLGIYLRPEGNYNTFTTTAVGSVRSPVTTLAAEGAMLSNEDIMEHVQAALMQYFLNAAENILTHHAPWEMESPVFHSKLSGTEEPINACALELDVVSAVKENELFCDGEGRRPPAGSPIGVGDESKRLQSVDWMFSMPKFETNITINAEKIKCACRDLSASDVNELMSGCSSISITTVVDRRHVTNLTISLTDASGMAHTCWCETILKAFIEGALVDEAHTSCVDDAVLSAAIHFECQNLLDTLGANGDVTIRLFLRAVLDIWWEKNAF